MPAKAGAVIATIPEGEEDETIAIGSAEEAKTTGRMVCHLPSNPHCEMWAKAKIQRKHKRNKVVMLEEYGIRVKKQPVKLGDQVTEDHMIKERRRY